MDGDFEAFCLLRQRGVGWLTVKPIWSEIGNWKLKCRWIQPHLDQINEL